MAQSKRPNPPPETRCARCGEPFRQHGNVYQRACERFRIETDEPVWRDVTGAPWREKPEDGDINF